MKSTRLISLIPKSSGSGAKELTGGMDEIIPVPRRELGRAGFHNLPAIIGRAGVAASWRFIEFFTATIRNKNTRAAYAQAITQFFA